MIPRSPPLFEWRRDTSDGSDRLMVEYYFALGMESGDLDGRVLDIGSGAHQYANAELIGRGVMADIISVNPDMSAERFRAGLLQSCGYEGKTLAAIGQQLPFRDASFDRILSLGTLTIYAGPAKVSKHSVQAWMGEVARVLKPDGVARLGPIYGTNDHDDYRAYFDEIYTDGSMTIEAVYNQGEQIVTDEDRPRGLYRMVIAKDEYKAKIHTQESPSMC